MNRTAHSAGQGRPPMALLAALLSLGAGLACVVFGDEFGPCPEPVPDEAALQAELEAHPLRAALRDQWTELDIAASSCVQDGRVRVYGRYRAPADYSAYGLEYETSVGTDYVLATRVWDSVELAGLPVAAEAGAMAETLAGAMAETLTGYIAEAEGDARVAEFLQRAPAPQAWLNSPAVSYQSVDLGWEMVYALDAHAVSSYSLPNSQDWPAFPEVALAQHLVATMLFTGDLAGCTIRREGLHAHTTRAGIYDSPDWRMTVHAECAGVWKDAAVRLHPDGSYSELGITWSQQ